jgi:hypothetical protein
MLRRVPVKTFLAYFHSSLYYFTPYARPYSISLSLSKSTDRAGFDLLSSRSATRISKSVLNVPRPCLGHALKRLVMIGWLLAGDLYMLHCTSCILLPPWLTTETRQHSACLRKSITIAFRPGSESYFLLFWTCCCRVFPLHQHSDSQTPHVRPRI